MNLLKSMIISFSMYSVIPMPRIDWDKDGMKYIFLFFPLVGLAIGGLSYGWLIFSAMQGIHSVLAGVILAVLPVVLSGGIHLDGLIDTCDAFFSYGDREKKLEILKDPRTGAFGVMGCAVYLLLSLGFYCQLIQSPGYAVLLVLIFFISRSLGVIALLTVRKAKSTGLGSTFAAAADNKLNLAVNILYLAAAFLVISFVNLIFAIVFAVLLAVYFLCCVSSIRKNFGGITGDLTGCFILLAELLMLLITAIGGSIC